MLNIAILQPTCQMLPNVKVKVLLAAVHMSDAL